MSVIEELDEGSLNTFLSTFYVERGVIKASLRSFKKPIYLVDLDIRNWTTSNQDEVISWLKENTKDDYVSDIAVGMFFFQSHVDAMQFYLTWGDRFV
jgi:hypothetical protein